MDSLSAGERPRNLSLDGSEESSIVRIDDDEVPSAEDGASMKSLISNRSTDPNEVTFHDVSDAYLEGQSIPCTFVVGPNVRPKNGDRVAIFRVPWSSIHDFVAFEWAKDTATDMRSRRQSVGDGANPVERRKVFAAANLRPLAADEDEYYQFCYVSEDGEILGSSATFQIFAENKDASSTTRTSVHEPCAECVVLRGRITQLEETLEAKSVSTFEPVNQAMAEDLQKSRERIRELSDQETLLKDKLRTMDKELEDVAQALEIVCGTTGGSPLAKISDIERRIDELESDRMTLRLLRHYAIDVAESSDVSLEEPKFIPLKENEVARLLDAKYREVAMLRSVVEAKEAELFEVKNELRVEKANTDELLKAMSDEMEAKNRVLEGTIRDLQEQAKKNLEVIASVGMINHARRDRVSQYLRDMAKDSKYSAVVRELGPVVMSILESQGSSTPKSPAKSVASVASAEEKEERKSERKSEERPVSFGGSVDGKENWETLSSVMDRSVSSQTSPVEPVQPSSKAPSMTSSMMSHPSLVEMVVPIVTEQVGSLLKTAIENALSGNGGDTAEAVGDDYVSEYGSVSSHAMGEEAEVVSHGPSAEVACESGKIPDSTVEENQAEDDVTPTGLTAEQEEAHVAAPGDVPEFYPTEDSSVPPIPEMMRRYNSQVEEPEQPAKEEEESQEQQHEEEQRAEQREPVYARQIDPATDFLRPMPVVNMPPQFPAPIRDVPTHGHLFTAPPPPPPPPHPRYYPFAQGYAAAGPPAYPSFASQMDPQSQQAFVRCHPSPFVQAPVPAAAPGHNQQPLHRPAPQLRPFSNPTFPVFPAFPVPIPPRQQQQPFPARQGPIAEASCTVRRLITRVAQGPCFPSWAPPRQVGLPPPLVPQRAPRTAAGAGGGGEGVAQIGHREISPELFLAELEEARVLALNAASAGVRTGTEASSSDAGAGTRAVDASSGVRVDEAAAAKTDAGASEENSGVIRMEVQEGPRAWDEEPKRVQCPICSVPFAGDDAAGLNQHIDAVHLSMSCPMCGDEYPREAEEIFLDHVNRCVDRSGTPDGHTMGFARAFVSDWID